jgi:hypothetical protein
MLLPFSDERCLFINNRLLLSINLFHLVHLVYLENFHLLHQQLILLLEVVDLLVTVTLTGKPDLIKQFLVERLHHLIMIILFFPFSF